MGRIVRRWGGTRGERRDKSECRGGGGDYISVAITLFPWRLLSLQDCKAATEQDCTAQGFFFLNFFLGASTLTVTQLRAYRTHQAGEWSARKSRKAATEGLRVRKQGSSECRITQSCKNLQNFLT